MLRSILICWLFFLSASNAASNILFYLPDNEKYGLNLAKALVQRKNHVTFVTNTPQGVVESPHFREIVVPPDESFESVLKDMTAKKYNFTKDPSHFYDALLKYKTESNRKTLKSPQLRAIFNDTFHLVILQVTTHENVQIGIADHFKAPWIGFSPLGYIFSAREMCGSESFTATLPHHLHACEATMNFYNRFANLVQHISDFVGSSVRALSDLWYETTSGIDDEYTQLWPPNAGYRSKREMELNMSLMFYNSHWSEQRKLRPLLPYEIEIGGIHMDLQIRSLAPELQEFFDSAEDGVIIWSAGHYFPINFTIPQEQLRVMFQQLSDEYKYKVLIKWPEHDVSALPANFMAVNELTDFSSMLAHHMVRLLITNGDRTSIMDAITREVPILALPSSMEEIANVEGAVRSGCARKLSIVKITDDSFSDALQDLLKNHT